MLLSLNKIILDKGIKAGVILSVVGALSRASLRDIESFPDELPITYKNRNYVVIEKPFEILSVSGNIGEIEGNPVIYAHITLSTLRKKEVESIGRHLIDGCVVFPFAEIVMAEISGISMKTIDNDTKTFQLFGEAE